MVAGESPWFDWLESKRGCNTALKLAGGQGGVPVHVACIANSLESRME